MTPRRRKTGELDLVGPQEIASRLDVRTQTVHMWNYRGVLPDPDWTISGTPVWRWQRIEDWARETGRVA